jgi:hypothetical protein
MTVRYYNVSVGTALKNGDIAVEGKSKGGAAQLNHVSLAYDDSVVTSKNQLLAGVRAILAQVQSDSSLT